MISHPRACVSPRDRRTLGLTPDVPLDEQGAYQLSSPMDGGVPEAPVEDVYCRRVVGIEAVIDADGHFICRR